jgi:hypothetical protein
MSNEQYYNVIDANIRNSIISGNHSLLLKKCFGARLPNYEISNMWQACFDKEMSELLDAPIVDMDMLAAWCVERFELPTEGDFFDNLREVIGHEAMRLRIESAMLLFHAKESYRRRKGIASVDILNLPDGGDNTLRYAYPRLLHKYLHAYLDDDNLQSLWCVSEDFLMSIVHDACEVDVYKFTEWCNACFGLPAEGKFFDNLAAVIGAEQSAQFYKEFIEIGDALSRRYMVMVHERAGKTVKANAVVKRVKELKDKPQQGLF